VVVSTPLASTKVTESPTEKDDRAYTGTHPGAVGVTVGVAVVEVDEGVAVEDPEEEEAEAVADPEAEAVVSPEADAVDPAEPVADPETVAVEEGVSLVGIGGRGAAGGIAGF